MNLISPRPTYHYRLPDCRIDEPHWSLALEWNRWVRIEEIAGDADLIAALCEGWQAHRARFAPRRSVWADEAARIVGGLF